MSPFRVWRHFDYVLLAVTVLLVAYGVLMIYSANLGSLDPDLHDLWRRQAMVGAIGIGLIFLLSIFPRDYEWLGDFWWLAYLLAVVLLVLAYFFGSSEIGDVAFFELIRMWVEIFSNRPATTLDFWQLAEQVSGQDLAWCF